MRYITLRTARCVPSPKLRNHGEIIIRQPQFNALSVEMKIVSPFGHRN